MLLLGFYACKNDDDIDTTEFFEPLSVDTLWYEQTESSQDLALKASMQVGVEVAEDAVNWCDAIIAGSGKGQAVSVHCTAFNGGDMRSTTLVLRTEQIERKLVICQLGSTPVLRALQGNYRLSLRDTLLKVPVISNVDYEVVSKESWVHALGVIKGNIVDTLRLEIPSTPYPRMSAEVLLTWKELTKHKKHKGTGHLFKTQMPRPLVFFRNIVYICFILYRLPCLYFWIDHRKIGG